MIKLPQRGRRGGAQKKWRNYAMKCWRCGAEATKTRDLTVSIYSYDEIVGKYQVPTKHQRNYCDKCFDAVTEERRRDNKQYLILKHKRMFENALDKLEHQGIIFEKYREAIKAVEEYNLENLDKFDSSYEIIAAIFFIQNHVRIKPQYKINNYQVDFFLPEYNLAVEIDGDRHTQTKDSARDQKLKQMQPGLKIIHIATVNLDKNASKLIEAINAVIRYRETGVWNTNDKSGRHESKT